jgi:hypothetical protein
MYISLIEGSFEEQSASLPGKLEISSALFLLVNSRAFLAARRALVAIKPFSTIFLATEGFSSKNLSKASEKTESVTVRTSEFPSFVFVCP